MNGGDCHPLALEARDNGQGRFDKPEDFKAPCPDAQSQNLLDQLPKRSIHEAHDRPCARSPDAQSQNLLDQLPKRSIHEEHLELGFQSDMLKQEEPQTLYEFGKLSPTNASKTLQTQPSLQCESVGSGGDSIQTKLMCQAGDDATAANMAGASTSTTNGVSSAQVANGSDSADVTQHCNRDWGLQWEQAFQSRMEQCTQSLEKMIAKQQTDLLHAVRQEIRDGMLASRRHVQEKMQKTQSLGGGQPRQSIYTDQALSRFVTAKIKSATEKSSRLGSVGKVAPSTQADGKIEEEREDSQMETGSSASEGLREFYEKKQKSKIFRITSRMRVGTSACAEKLAVLKPALPKAMPRNAMTRITNGKMFGTLSSGLIMLNAVFIGMETDAAVKCALKSEDLPTTFALINKIFTICFVVELVMRCIGERIWFFVGTEWRWNWFDAVLVLSSLIQMLLEGMVSSLSFARILRAFRMVRATRVIKVLRFFHELRRMVSSIVSSLASLGWALLLLGLIKYLVAICLTQAATGYVRDHYDPASPSEQIIAIQTWYSSLSMSMLSLMLSISGGTDWYEVASPLESVSIFYLLFFVFYVFFVIFGVLNVLVGVFLASAAEVMDRDVIVQSEIMKTNAAVKELHMLFNEIDKNNTGQISLNELDEYLQDEKAQAYFAYNCLDPTDPLQLFKLMDKDGDGQVDMREFIFSMMKCKGQAKGTDMRALMQEVKRTQEKLEMMVTALMGDPDFSAQETQCCEETEC